MIPMLSDERIAYALMCCSKPRCRECPLFLEEGCLEGLCEAAAGTIARLVKENAALRDKLVRRVKRERL